MVWRAVLRGWEPPTPVDPHPHRAVAPPPTQCCPHQPPVHPPPPPPMASYWRSQPLAGRLRAILPTLVGYVWVFCLISLRLKFLKIDEGFLWSKIACYDHFMSYMFWYYKHKHTKWYQFLQFFSRFLKIFVIFCLFPASGASKSPLRFDNRALYSV